jgi:trk system potassium uptake protein
MKCAVIGIGRFGYQLAISLAEQGIEVLAVDSNERIIASIRDKVTQAVCVRVTDESSLRDIGVEEMDTAVVSMGENFAQSILVTALLKRKLKTPRVIARSTSLIHKEILFLVGVDQVVFPEQESGIYLAEKLSSPFSDHTRVSANFLISHIPAPESFVGQTVDELRLFSSYSVKCLGILDKEEIDLVGLSYVVEADDTLVLVGKQSDLQKVAAL